MSALEERENHNKNVVIILNSYLVCLFKTTTSLMKLLTIVDA